MELTISKIFLHASILLCNIYSFHKNSNRIFIILTENVGEIEMKDLFEYYLQKVIDKFQNKSE